MRVTAEGTFVFQIGPGEADVTAEQVIYLPPLNGLVVRDFLMRFDGDTPGGRLAGPVKVLKDKRIAILRHPVDEHGRRGSRENGMGAPPKDF